MNDSCENPAGHIARIMKRLYEQHLTTTSGGNISVRDAEGCIWITPGGIDKGNLLPEDIVRILPDGTFEGRHRPSLEAPIHLGIYRIRPDVHAVLHAHPAALSRLQSGRAVLPNTSLLPQSVCSAVSLQRLIMLVRAATPCCQKYPNRFEKALRSLS